MKYSLAEYEFGESTDSLPEMQKVDVDEELEEIQTLATAIRYNHDIGDFQSIDMAINPEWEMENYNLKITQLTLPHRFGMYREQMRGVPIKTPVEVEDP